MRYKFMCILVLINILFMTSCDANFKKNKEIITKDKDSSQSKEDEKTKSSNYWIGLDGNKILNEAGSTIFDRFYVPKGYERVSVERESFAEFLRNLKLKPNGSKVLYYDGREKNKSGVYEAVVDISIGNRDLHQCADAVMLLRAEYLYKQKRLNEINFNFVSGFKAEYSKWMQGYRIKVSGNDAIWVKDRAPSENYNEFRKFMDIVFAYANTLSLEKEMVAIEKDSLNIGDVFIKGPDPGHTVIVVDMALNPKTGEKLFMLAQSYMPAQETQILQNPNNKNISPWYLLNFQDQLNTPEWTFSSKQVKRFLGE